MLTWKSPTFAILRVLGATALTLALLLGVRASASAQSVCASHAEVMKQLDGRYSESPIGMGLASNGGVVEMFSAVDGASWTIAITTPDGRTCVLLAGEAWEILPRMVAGPQA